MEAPLSGDAVPRGDAALGDAAAEAGAAEPGGLEVGAAARELVAEAGGLGSLELGEGEAAGAASWPQALSTRPRESGRRKRAVIS